MKTSKMVLLWFTVLYIASTPVHSYYSPTKPAPKLAQKLTNLHFYLHDTLSGQNPSARLVARLNMTRDLTTSPADSGDVFVVDDVLTVGPDPNSEVVGNARGLWSISSRKTSEFTLVLYLDFGFTTGEFNGSSISVFSRNPVVEDPRELAVVGGRGKFRMARGFVEAKTNKVDFVTGDAVVEYNVAVYHY